LSLNAKLVKDHGGKCFAAIVPGIAAAARCISIAPACLLLSNAPGERKGGHQKLLFAAWRVHGATARIFHPHAKLSPRMLFPAVALLPRNPWV